MELLLVVPVYGEMVVILQLRDLTEGAAGHREMNLIKIELLLPNTIPGGVLVVLGLHLLDDGLLVLSAESLRAEQEVHAVEEIPLSALIPLDRHLV